MPKKGKVLDHFNGKKLCKVASICDNIVMDMAFNLAGPMQT